MKTSSLISVSAYAKIKGCLPTYIFRMVREKRLKHKVIAGKICIDKDAIIESKLTTKTKSI